MRAAWQAADRPASCRRSNDAMTKPHVADAFLPNRAVSPNVFKILLVGEAIMAIALWWLLPMRVIPKPGEVFNALGSLWMEGLGRELIISFTLNLQAIFWTTVIALLISY